MLDRSCWKNYKRLLNCKSKVNLKESLSGNLGIDRIRKYNCDMSSGLRFNYATKEINDEILSVFNEMVNESNVLEKFKELYNGEYVNIGENRRVLHHLCRGQLGGDVIDDNVNKREFYINEQKKIEEFASKIHSGTITNENNEKYTTVVQIGIGGSDLGPRAMYIALENYARRKNLLKMEAKFISNVDPDDAAYVLKSIDISKTLFILVSKSGTTLETLTNEAFVKEEIKKHNLEVNKHLIAVTSMSSPLAKSNEYMACFFMDDFIGGRYSSTSSVGGAILTLSFGAEIFNRFLSGAHNEDKNALNSDLNKNAALLDALIGIYERNVLGYEACAVLPYSQALSRFPAHLQQLDMESNGKSVNRFGEEINYKTGPIIFGEPGTNGQHSFYQLLHQGKTIIPIQFIGFKNSQLKMDINIENSTSQQKLCANVISQMIAFALGSYNENKNKNFDGNRPSSIIIGDELSPEALGALLAHYENKVMFQGFLWNINSFDQEGVQLGKVLAKKVLKHEADGALLALSKMFGI